MADDLFGALESAIARTPRQPALAVPPLAPRAPERQAPAVMSDPQRQGLRTAASLLAGHFRAEAAPHLRQAGPFGAAALEAIEAGAEPMAARAIIMDALAAAPAGSRRG